MDALTQNAPSTELSKILMQRKKEIECLTSTDTLGSNLKDLNVKEKKDNDGIETITLPEDAPRTRPKSAFGPPEDTPMIVSREVQEEMQPNSPNDKEVNKQASADAIAPMPFNAGAPTTELGLGVNVKANTVLRPKLFGRLPHETILRCRLYRKKNLLDKAYPTFFLYNEADDKFMLAGRRRKKTKSLTYLISTSPDDLSKDSMHYIAKLK